MLLLSKLKKVIRFKMPGMIEHKSRKTIKNEKKVKEINKIIEYNSDDKNGIVLLVHNFYDSNDLTYDEILESIEYILQQRGTIDKIYWSNNKNSVYDTL